MAMKISFHFHPNVVMETQIDKFRTENTIFLRRYDVTSPGARAVLYQTIWQDFHFVRGHGVAHYSFWTTKEFCIQLIAFLQTLKYARPDKSNAIQRNLTLEK